MASAANTITSENIIGQLLNFKNLLDQIIKISLIFINLKSIRVKNLVNFIFDLYILNQIRS